LASNQAIEDIFKFLDIEITNKQLEFIYIELFKSSNNINQLEYKQLLEIFSKRYVPKDEIPFLEKKRDIDLEKKQRSPKRMTENKAFMVLPSSEQLMDLNFGKFFFIIFL